MRSITKTHRKFSTGKITILSLLALVYLISAALLFTDFEVSDSNYLNALLVLPIFPAVLAMAAYGAVGIWFIGLLVASFILGLFKKYRLAASSFITVVMLNTILIKQRIMVNDKDELTEMVFGAPFKFITQDRSHLDPPYPYYLGLGSALENPTRPIWGGLILSTILIMLALYLALTAAKNYFEQPKSV
jgi:hypothetical protein